MRPVSPSPPLRTVRAAFTAHGSAPLVHLHGAPLKPLLPLRRPPQDFPRVGCHVAGLHAHNARGPLTRSLGTLCADSLCPPYFQRLGAFAMGSRPRVSGFPGLRLLRPIRHASPASGCRPGSPPSSCPPPFTSGEKLPGFSLEDASAMMEVACCWLPRPRLAASPSPDRGGQGDLSCHGHAPMALAPPRASLQPFRAGLAGL